MENKYPLEINWLDFYYVVLDFTILSLFCFCLIRWTITFILNNSWFCFLFGINHSSYYCRRTPTMIMVRESHIEKIGKNEDFYYEILNVLEFNRWGKFLYLFFCFTVYSQLFIHHKLLLIPCWKKREKYITWFYLLHRMRHIHILGWDTHSHIRKTCTRK